MELTDIVVGGIDTVEGGTIDIPWGGGFIVTVIEGFNDEEGGTVTVTGGFNWGEGGNLV